MARSLVELFEAIRRDHRRGVSVRALAQRYGVHRRTVRAAIDSAAPPPSRKSPERAAPRLEPFKPAIDAMLRTDLSAPRKQRHTVWRILARLIEENHAGDRRISPPNRSGWIQSPRGAVWVAEGSCSGSACLITRCCVQASA